MFHVVDGIAALVVCAALLADLCNVVVIADAFYMPGVLPLTFREGDEVPLKVNSLTSFRTLVPKDFYQLPFCRPVDGPVWASMNLGEILTGNLVQTSPYRLYMRQDAYCMILCQEEITKAEAENLKMAIRREYRNNWIVDNLPSAYMGINRHGTRMTTYSGGFPIGFVDEISVRGSEFDAYIYNHVNIHLEYKVDRESIMGEEGYRIVAFGVEPMSIKHEFVGGRVWDGLSSEFWTTPLQSCPNHGHNIHTDRGQISHNQIVQQGEKIIYTYDVIWHESEVSWSSRWVIYLTANYLVPPQVHWNAIFNASISTLILSVLLVRIVIAKLHRNMASFSAVAACGTEDDGEGDKTEGTQLKLMQASEVVVEDCQYPRPQTQPLLYAVLVGSGVHLGVVAMIVIVLSLLGFFNPARRGCLVIGILSFFALCSPVGGYSSARLYRAFRGRAWQQCAFYTAALYPGICFAFFLVVNVLLFFHHSPGSAPLMDVAIVAVLWCGLSMPLAFAGAYFGYKMKTISLPNIAEFSDGVGSSPLSAGFRHYYAGMTVAGLLPFSVIVTELVFIMGALWMGYYYYAFGFTCIVYILLLVTCSLVAILLCHFQIRGGNHQLWWYSFLVGGSTGFYVFAFSVVWFRHLRAAMAMTYLLYFGYMLLFSFTVALITGAVGALSWLWLLRATAAASSAAASAAPTP